MVKLLNVTKRYKTNTALNNVSLDIKEKDVVLFIGQNGSGKSTCLKLINKVIFLGKYDSGEVKNSFELISYLPEKFAFPTLIKTKEYLKIFKNLYHLNIDLNNIMEEYKIPNKLISSLSKGMRQKLGIIISLMTPANLYIFDEPTDGLDKDSKNIFINHLKQLNDKGKTILISTHNKNDFKDISKKVFTFEGGVLCKKTHTSKKDT